MHQRVTSILLGVLLALGFSVTAAVAPAWAAPSVVVDSLTVPTGAAPTQNVGATARVRSTSGSVRVQAVTVAVRKAGQAYDFPGAVAATIPTSGYTFTSGKRLFPAGTYQAFVAVQVNNQWYNLASSKTFTVAAAAPTVVLDSLTVPTGATVGSPVTASARLHSSAGTISAQAVTIAVRKAGEAFDFPGAKPASITTAGYTFTSDPRTFEAPGTYEAIAAVQVNNTWTNLSPTKTFTVGATPNRLVFSEEFNGRAGQGPNADRSTPVWFTDRCWRVENCTGTVAEYRDDHAVRDGSNLVLTADRNVTPGAMCGSRPCTHAASRLTMRDWANNSGRPTWEKLGGHWEARVQLPTGQGLWPAFWTVGNGGWPMTGEIDIMENLGSEPNQIHQVLHYGPDDEHDTNWDQTAPVPGGVTGFHTYAMDWNNSANGYIKWSVDGVVTRTVTAAQANARQAGLWERIRTNPQNIIINLSVGGDWPGNPPAGPMSVVMKVDYIRVYENAMK